MEILKKINSEISPIFSGRFYAVTIPDDEAYPCGRYSVISITEEPFVDAGNLLERQVIQIDIFSKKYGEAVNLRRQVQQALRAIPEFIEQGTDFDDYDYESKCFRWVLQYTFRDLTVRP